MKMRVLSNEEHVWTSNKFHFVKTTESKYNKIRIHNRKICKSYRFSNEHEKKKRVYLGDTQWILSSIFTKFPNFPIVWFSLLPCIN